MAETTNRSDAKEGRQTLAPQERQDRDRGALQRRESFAGPFAMMDRMAEEMDRTFDRMFRDFGLPRRSWPGRSPLSWAAENAFMPRIEAFHKGDRFIVRADLPGLKKDDIQVEVTDDAVVIQGERRSEHQEEREGYYHNEREYGRFHRQVPLPEGVIGESAEASFKDGVLEVSMQAPPAEARRGRKVEVKEGPEQKNK